MHPYSTVSSIAQRLVQVHGIVEKITGVNGPLITEFDCESLFFRDNFLRVDVYYGDLKYQKIEQQPSYLILNFFSK